MTQYREILRLKSLGFSDRNIAHSCGVSRNTVAKVTKKASEINLSWPLDFFRKISQPPSEGCLTLITSVKNYYGTESTKNSSGWNTVRNAA